MSDIEDANSNQGPLVDRIKSLELRLRKIESILRIEWQGELEDTSVSPLTEDTYTAEHAETHIVQYGLAWLGSIVFVFGIVFLMSFTENLGHPLLAKIVAYLATFILLTSSYFLRKPFPVLANVLTICSSLLLFYITVKLHFFTEQPLLTQKGIAIFLLLLLIALQVYNALRKNSEFYATIAITFCIVTAIISDYAYLTFSMLMVTAIVSLVLFYNRLWWRVHIYSLFMVYIAHLIWLLGNPIMGHKMGIVALPEHNILFLIAYAIIYSVSVFIPKEKLASNAALISISIWNALGFSILLLMVIPSFYKEDYIIIFSVIAFFNLLLAVILKLKLSRDFAPATYACFSFIAISIAIYGYAGLPNAYFLLVIESFLVVSMALWFRSKIIVVANALLFISILLIYFITSESISLINFTFAITALATARILKWKIERLTLKTDAFRSIYLIIAFFMILYGLNEALPSNYVTIAWTATALGFFTLSFILHNLKYRYLAILTIVVTGGHLFFVDLGQMEIGFRVIAFFVFAIISLGVSLYYTKRMKK